MGQNLHLSLPSSWETDLRVLSRKSFWGQLSFLKKRRLSLVVRVDFGTGFRRVLARLRQQKKSGNLRPQNSATFVDPRLMRLHIPSPILSQHVKTSWKNATPPCQPPQGGQTCCIERHTYHTPLLKTSPKMQKIKK